MRVKQTLGVMMVVSFFASVAVAQPRHEEAGMVGPERAFRPEMIESMATELGVADAVVVQIRERAYKADQEAIKLRAELDTARLALRRLMDEDNPDVARVMKQVEALGAVETELKKSRIRLLLSVRELLTADQRKKLRRLAIERMRGAGPGDDDDDGFGKGLGGGRHNRGGRN